MHPHQHSLARLTSTLLYISGLLVLTPAQAVFFNPPGNQTPSSISGNSRRGGCAIDEADSVSTASRITPDALSVGEVNPTASEPPVGFLPIVPDPTRVVALTTQASASLWVYVPPTQAQSVEFSLFDSVTNQFIYTGRFAIETSGIYQVDIPETIELKADTSDAPQDYLWFLDLVCDSTNPTANLSETGTIKRLEPAAVGDEFEQQLAVAIDDVDRAKVYGNYGLWLDMVAAIGTDYAHEISGDHTIGDPTIDDLNLDDLTISDPTATAPIHSEAQSRQEWLSILEVALPVSERDDVDREQQLQLLLDADVFIAELTEVSPEPDTSTKPDAPTEPDASTSDF